MDTKLRKLERNWQQTGTEEDHLEVLRIEVRSARATPSAVKLAASLGDPMAQRLAKEFGDTPPARGLSALTNLSITKLDLSVASDLGMRITDSTLKTVAAIPTLQHLSLYRCKRITDAALHHLHNLPALRSLDLRWCEGITDAGLRWLNPSLTELNLQGCTGLTECAFEALANLPHLKSLKARDTATDEALRHLTSLNQLHTLDLYLCRGVTDQGLRHLTALPGLRDLNLTLTGVTTAGLQHLLPIPLESLTLTHVSVDPGVLGTHPTLERLNINSTNLTDTSLEQFHGSRVRELDMSVCLKLTENALPILATSIPKLERLNISYSRYNRVLTERSGEGLESLRHLQRLDLGSSEGITPQLLHKIGTLKALTHLNLCHCKEVTTTGAKQLRSLKNLVSLNLGESKKLTDGALKSLATLPNLSKLGLSRCLKLTDAGLAHLATLTSLTDLTLTKNGRITPDGLRHLLPLPNLRKLNVVGCKKITTAEVDLFPHLENSQWLKQAILENKRNSSPRPPWERNRH